jgi:hypothetical protein
MDRISGPNFGGADLGGGGEGISRSLLYMTQFRQQHSILLNVTEVKNNCNITLSLAQEMTLKPPASARVKLRGDSKVTLTFESPKQVIYKWEPLNFDIGKEVGRAGDRVLFDGKKTITLPEKTPVILGLNNQGQLKALSADFYTGCFSVTNEGGDVFLIESLNDDEISIYHYGKKESVQVNDQILIHNNAFRLQGIMVREEWRYSAISITQNGPEGSNNCDVFRVLLSEDGAITWADMSTISKRYDITRSALITRSKSGYLSLTNEADHAIALPIPTLTDDVRGILEGAINLYNIETYNSRGKGSNGI